MTRHQLTSALFVAILLVTLGARKGYGDSAPDLTYHSTVSEVQVTFFVTGDDNDASSIDRDDFAIVDNQLIVRRFRSFTKSQDVTPEVLVLVDTSASVFSRFGTEIASVMKLVSQDRWVSDNHLSIMFFGAQGPTLVCAGTCRESDALARLMNAKTDGLTPLFDALESASEFVLQRRTSNLRPVIILLSDGRDTVSEHSWSDAGGKLRYSEAVIYSVDLSAPGEVSGSSGTMKSIAEATGGRYFSIRDGAGEIVNSVLCDLQHGYTVTYSVPDRTPGFHQLRVLPTRHLNLRFRCRSGYYYPRAND